MGAIVDVNNAIDYKTANPINKNDGIDTIYITAAGYKHYPFKCATPDSGLGFEERVFGADLTRSTNFVLTNILDVDYGLVARVEITYAYMNITDYRVLCKISQERVCYVTYFNREKAEWVQDQEFAFTTQELNKLYAFGSHYFGALDITVSLVATNRDLAETKIGKVFEVTFNMNGGTGDIDDLAQRDSDGKYILDKDGNKQYNNPKNVVYGGAISLPTSTGFSYAGKTFDGWSLQSTLSNAQSYGVYYMPKQPVTVWGNMTFYARWK